MIYRRTRGSRSGEYLMQLSAKQQQKVTARWRRDRNNGRIRSRDDCLLGYLEDNPAWKIWRRVRRYRVGAGSTIERKDYVLDFGKPVRLIKTRPAPASY